MSEDLEQIIKKTRTTKAKDPSKDKRKETWKNNLAKAHSKQKEMKELYAKNKLKEIEIYSESESDYSDSLSSSESEEEYVIKPKKQTKPKKTKQPLHGASHSKQPKHKASAVMEELQQMRKLVNKLTKDRKVSKAGNKKQVIQLIQPSTNPVEKPINPLIEEIKKKTLINF